VYRFISENLPEKFTLYAHTVVTPGSAYMAITFAMRREMSKKLGKKYRISDKKTKGALIDSFVEMTGYNRHYAAYVLRQKSVTHTRPPRRGIKRYDEEMERIALQIWYIYDMICGKRLAPYMAEAIAVLERVHELSLTDEQRSCLSGISSATLDRMIRKERKRKGIRHKGTTKPGTLLKNSIPIRTYAAWDENAAGYMEIDLVGHEGGNASGFFNSTLTATDIKTCWTQLRAVENKAEVRVFEALQDIRYSLPFPLKGIDSDNGSEFINAHLKRYCTQEEITFTRARSGNKNDNCYVEQKNWSVVRRHVGYARYDTAYSCSLLNQLYLHVNLYVNYFQPVMTCCAKERDGSKVRKHYTRAATPFARVMAETDIDEKEKRTLEDIYVQLNPVELKKNITRMQKKLYRLSGAANQRRRSQKRR
jgi:hypothetical protein